MTTGLVSLGVVTGTDSLSRLRSAEYASTATTRDQRERHPTGAQARVPLLDGTPPMEPFHHVERLRDPFREPFQEHALVHHTSSPIAVRRWDRARDARTRTDPALMPSI